MVTLGPYKYKCYSAGCIVGELPCVAVFLDCIIAVVKLTIMVTWALVRENTAVTLERHEDTMTTLTDVERNKYANVRFLDP